MSDEVKVGIISCSGEEIPEGTVSRLATRRVLDSLRPGRTVTLCLPLFLAGDEAEREFARRHPTITVDGCDKLCAKKGTEQYSGPVAASLVVSDLLGGRELCCARSTRASTESDEEAVWIVSEHIAAAVDVALDAEAESPSSGESSCDAGCSCSAPAKGIRLDVGGRTVNVTGLPLIFEHLAKSGLPADESSADKLLETVRIHHEIESAEEDAYKAALLSAYKSFRGCS